MDIRKWFSVDAKVPEHMQKQEHMQERKQEEQEQKIKIIKIYTDGSSLGNGQSYCKYGGIGVYFGDNDNRNISQGILRQGITNNQCELLAILYAIRKVKETESEIIIKHCHLEIYTDSKLAVNTFMIWIYGWEKRGWKKKDNTDIKNLTLIKTIYEELKSLKCEFIHVPAHKKNKFKKHSKEWEKWHGNFMADYFANSASTQLQKKSC